MLMGRRSFLTGAAAGITSGILLPLCSAQGATKRLKIRDIYKTQAEFSQIAKDYASNRDKLEITGFMAPPLKANAAFFVLTSRPMAVCPFCESSADWPNDIVFVRTNHIIDAVAFNRPIVTRGILKLGVAKDKETGFVSLVRLVDATFDTL